MVLAESGHIDEYEGVKIRLTNNTVYDNVNKVQYLFMGLYWRS